MAGEEEVADASKTVTNISENDTACHPAHETHGTAILLDASSLPSPSSIITDTNEIATQRKSINQSINHSCVGILNKNQVNAIVLITHAMFAS